LGDHPVPVVFTLAERPDGRLWLGTDNGILRFDPGASLVRRYGLADGLQDLEFNAGAVAALADGRLAFGGVRGLNLFDPARIADSRYTPPVRLLGAWIGSDTSAGSSALWQSSKLEIPDGAGILRLRIGALDFGPNSGIRYRYRMDGFDRDWIDNGPRQDITYTRLPPGRYLFRAHHQRALELTERRQEQQREAEPADQRADVVDGEHVGDRAARLLTADPLE
ncbi:hypothetical protein JTP77_044165, partial [Streptomyces sp. S9]|nr:hypothetical protein [Streptomyces sp. S9]